MSALTVSALAEAKRLPERFLCDLGLRDVPSGVAIPYLDTDGKFLYERTRLSLGGGQRFSQPLGVSVVPYGLDRLIASREAEKPLILVEGESDAWTLWQAGISCLGLPGASMAGKLQREHLQGIKQVFAVREPGNGGDKFISGIAKRLQQIGFRGEAFEVSLAPFKDPSALYCDNPPQFRERFMEMLNHPTVLALGPGNQDQPCKGFQPLGKYLEMVNARSEKTAYWSGILREGEVSILAGRAMAGKSTFACALARALTKGDSFLGRACLISSVGYMALERNGSTVGKLLGKWGLKDIAFLDEVPALQGAQLASFLEEQIVQHGLNIIIVDHLQNLIRLADSNDYARVSLALEPFQKVAKRTGAHLILLHHQGKTRREGEIDVMGSEAFRTAADVIIEATRSDGRHYVRANIRGEADLPRTMINVDLESGNIEASNAMQMEVQEALASIVDFLKCQEDWQKGDTIREAVGLKQKVVTDALKLGGATGKINQLGGGRKGNPYLYQTSDFVSCSDHGNAGNESTESQNHQRGQGLNDFPNHPEMNGYASAKGKGNCDHQTEPLMSPNKEWVA